MEMYESRKTVHIKFAKGVKSCTVVKKTATVVHVVLQILNYSGTPGAVLAAN